MKKLLILLIVFLSINFNIGYCENLNEYNLDDFVCNYYENIINNVELLIEQEDYHSAKIEIEDLYNSKCKTKY